jgi:molybdopterin converting factor subunit 1
VNELRGVVDLAEQGCGVERSDLVRSFEMERAGRREAAPMEMDHGDRYNTFMRVRVLFFGQLKDIVGFAEDAADLAEGGRVEDLFARYGNRFPDLARFRKSVVASINEDFADWGAPLKAGDEVAFLPPVSGGS